MRICAVMKRVQVTQKVGNIMNLNRKSAKTISQVSLVIAVTMVITLVVTVETQGIPADYLAKNGLVQNSAQICKAGLVDLFTKLLW